MTILRPLVTTLIDLLYPPACWACRAPLERQADGFCGACALVPLGNACPRCAEPQGPYVSPSDCENCRGRRLHFRHVLALGRYEGGLQTAIRRAKFGGEAAIWRWMGQALAEAAAQTPWTGGIDAVTPVPSTRRARFARGFNPAMLLARPVAGRLGRPLLHALRRQDRGVPQVGLGRSARLANVEGAFRAGQPDLFSGRRILLIDDVMTTGATVSACARAFMEAGAASVDVAVVGR